MEIVRFADAPAYSPPNHDEVSPRRLQGDKATSADFVMVGYTDFPPGAAVPMEAAAIGKVYVVVSGILCFEQEDGVTHRLGRLDSLFVPAGEARAVLNDTDAPAAVIVVTPPPAGR